MMTTKNVAMLGLGAMGGRIAQRLAAEGHALTLWNRTTDAASGLAQQLDADVASRPADAVVDADVVISMVADDHASQSVWLDSDRGALAA